MADIVLSVTSKVAEYLVAPVCRRCGYVIFPNSYFRQLKNELKKLHVARDRVQRSIDEAEYNGKQIERDVKNWVQGVEIVTNKARDVLEYDGRAKKTCFCGWLPNPKVRYCLGREARRRIEEIQKLIASGGFEVHFVVDSDGNTIFWSRAPILADIMNALNDEKFKVIGIHGPRGVGKTTLLEEVQEKLRNEKRLFDLIVTTTVSRSPDLKNIQDSIAYALSLDLKNEPSEVRRRDLLFQKLQSDPTKEVLIILDDLWGELDLKAVGIPLGDKSRGCKLLLTSSFKDVLEQKMLADRTFTLEGLKDEEAFRLFEKMVGDRLKSNEELKAIAARVVKRLGGLPLLITSVASTLKFGSVSAWKNVLTKIDELNTKIIVKLSYDLLENEDAKSLFLLCGLIGGTIQVETLLGLCVGLGLFERFNSTIQHSRDRLKAMIDSLRSLCLLQDGGDDKENVTIHDLYSEVVVSTPFRGQNSLVMNNNYDPWSMAKLEKCWAICLVNVGRDRIAELTRGGFSDLKILMLSQSEDWLGSPTHQYDVKDCCRLDFRYMKELQVLYLRSMHITTLPSSIKILRNLQSLNLDFCNMEDVAILGKLEALQILSFAGSTIYRLPKEIGELTNLRSLNLSNCKELHIIEPGVLGRLINLEELYMKRSFERWMGKDEILSESYNASLAELKSLTKLTTLEISIRDPTVLFNDGDLPFGNLIKFWISIGVVDGREFEGLRNMKLKLGECNSIILEEWVQKSLQKTQYLHLDGLREFDKNAHDLCTRGFSQLKHLDILNSPSIEYIASSSHPLLLIEFTILESLFIENLINLKKICHGPIAQECFSKLKAVHIKRCHLLKNLWFLYEMQGLVHLEEIQVHECDSMEAIITYDARIIEVAADDIVELPNVRHLDLRMLPNMTGFCIGAKRAPIQVAFPRLGTLEITGLDNLRFMFLPSMVKSLACLRELRVSDCLNMEAIITEEEGWGMEASKTLAFPMLTDLHLQRLKRVTCFSRTKCSQEAHSEDSFNSHSIAFFNQEVAFPILKTLEITGLDNLGFMFLPSMVKYLAQLRRLRVSDCMNMGAIIMEEEGWGMEASKTLAFSMLTVLHLKHLDRLTCFSRAKCSREARSQDDFKSTTLFNQEVAFPRLETLEITCLDNLRFMFLPSMVKSLERLRELRVSDCMNMEAIIMEEEGWGMEASKTLAFPMLTDLHLQHLKRVTCFSRTKGSQETQSENGFNSRSTALFNQEVAFPRLETLEITCLDNLRFLFLPSMVKSLARLRELRVSDCMNMEAIITDEEGWGMEASETLTFPILTDLHLQRLKRVTCFSRTKCSQEARSENGFNSRSTALFNQEVAFPKLEILEITGLDNPGFMVLSSMVKYLAQLRELKVSECMNMGAIIMEEEGWGLEASETLAFPMLNKLHLHRLECLTCFSHTNFSQEAHGQDNFKSHSTTLFNQEVAFPNLETLEIFAMINIDMIWNNHVYFRHLKTLTVSSCDRLSHILTPTIVGNLVELKNLTITSCQILTQVMVDEGGEEGHVVAFKQLKYLKLHMLAGLKCFSSGGYTLVFPLLEDVILVGCLNIKFFSERPIELPKLDEVTKREMCFWKENLNVISQKILAMIAKEKTMRLSEFPMLIEKWHNQLNSIELSWQLESLMVDECPSFTNAIPSKMMLVLDNMKTLQVHNCESLEEIFDLEGLEGVERTRVLPSFMILDLVNLPKLRRLWNKDLQGILCLNTLQGLTLHKCSNLRHAFTQSMAHCLANLQWMEIKECSQMEGVIGEEEVQGSIVEKITFSNLDRMKLECLPNLTSFLSGKNHMLECPRLVNLSIAQCPKMRSLTWQSLIEIDDNTSSLFTLQKTLQVHDCESLEEIFDLEGLEGVERTWVLPSFMTLDLVNLPKLRRLWNNDLQGMLCFSTLQGLTLYKCSNLRHAFTRSMAQCLATLQWMEIKECSQMEGVIGEEKGQGSTVEKITFSNLDWIKLECLPNLTSFFSGKNHILECPRVVDLSIAQCPKMRSLTWQSLMEIDDGTLSLFTPQVVFPSLEELCITDIGYIKMIWDNHVALSFPRHFRHLKTLDVSHCIELSNMFTLTMIGNLVELTKLRISNCKMLTEIISDDGCKEGPIVTFKQLKYMELEELIGLTCFSSGRYTLSFPLLEDVIVIGCLNMKFFSEAPIRAPKLKPKRAQVSTEMWFWEKKIRMSMQNMSIDTATVDGVEFMHLSGFSELTENWHSKLIPKKSSWQLKSLVVDKCPSFLNAISFRLMLVLDKINTLQVQDCESLEEIFNLEGPKAIKGTQVLPQLWCLNLVNLPKLTRLWNKDLQGTLCFSSLSYLTLCNCSNLRHALSPSMARCLPTLQWMEIRKCDQMEGVMVEEEGEGSGLEQITFLRLHWMELEHLPNLTSFFSGTNHTLECPRLQELTIAHCPKIITFTWQSLMKIEQGISSPFTPQVPFPRVKSMVFCHMDNSRKTWVDGSQHLWKAKDLVKLRVEFRVTEEIGLPTIT